MNRFLNHPLFLMAIVVGVSLEYVLSKRRNLNNFDLYEVYSNFLFISIDRVLTYFTGSDGGAISMWFWNHRFVEITLTGWSRWFFLFFIAEFVYYWVHWYNHHVNLGWATHIMHHSPTKYNLTTGYRLGITRLFSLGWIIGLPVILFGVHPSELAGLLGFVFLYNFFIHTELIKRMGWLDFILNTPSNHRVHHAAEPLFYNKNLGGMTVIFDHIFGTYCSEPTRGLQYGIPEVMEKRKLGFEIFVYWHQVFRKVRSSKSLMAMLKAIFGAPGAIFPQTKKQTSGSVRPQKTAPIHDDDAVVAT